MNGRWSLGNAGVYYALVAIVVVLTIVSAVNGRTTYLSLENAANVLDQTAWVAILAVAMTVVLISGNFDLSVGSVAAFSGAVVMLTLDSFGPVAAIALSLGAGVLFGLANGLLVQRIGINAFIVTLGTMTAIRGLLYIVTNSRTVVATTTVATISPLQNGTWSITSAGIAIVGIALAGFAIWRAMRDCRTSPRPSAGAIACGGVAAGMVLFGPFTDLHWRLTLPVLYMVIITGAAWFILRHTLIGRRLYAVGGNKEAAHLAGIAVDRYKIAAFVVTGLAAAMVGVLYTGEIKSINPGTFEGLELNVLAAAILGGTSLFGGSGSVVKSVAGALILTTLTNGFNILNLGARYQSLVVGLVIIAAAAIYTARMGGGPKKPAAGANLPRPAAGGSQAPSPEAGM